MLIPLTHMHQKRELESDNSRSQSACRRQKWALYMLYISLSISGGSSQQTLMQKLHGASCCSKADKTSYDTTEALVEGLYARNEDAAEPVLNELLHGDYSRLK